ncbi:Serine/threonine-protein kinase PknB [Rubripirellula lacrimiformis]|uniref:Serine/threonine-protein kinase PknB n=1 Tax=Rubripirellula lacrimiformis TaxID=1930273 RepID=A0A517NEN0_9BACT|nr:protein kinase [Rubripirellula lacrimiformis]QDT05589.1 Serine/threonine-protein kinase PknB [Rubripirellula lacrimiformis]
MLKRGFQFAPGYRLQEFLGRGQFGQVWRATAPGGAAAAVKFIDLSDGQGQKEYDGVRRVKQIRHANLMPITAIWLLDGEGKVIEEAPDVANETIDLSIVEGKGQSGLFVPQHEVEPSWLAVSMLLGGQSLQARLRDCVKSGLPGIPPKELISYMDESAKGIDFLNSPIHDLGDGPIAIQHSDIKPANIVLIGSSAVVCDFGLARILTRNQVTATSAAGTPAYMAPEAISGKPSRSSDQYALAVTYYHLRTGTLPVNDGSLWEVLDAHRQGNLHLDQVSPAEQEVIRKATDLKWEQRFETNVDMVDALRDALRAEGQTKPSFVASGAGISGFASPTPSGTAAETADLGNLSTAGEDFTATLDTVPDAVPTEPFAVSATQALASDQSTAEGFFDETIASVPIAGTATGATIGTHTGGENGRAAGNRFHPKVVAGVVGGGLVLLFIAIVAMGGGDSQDDAGDGSASVSKTEQSEASGHNGGDKDVAETKPIVVGPDGGQRTADQWMTSAIELLATDPVAASEQFGKAMATDVSLAVPATIRMPGHQGEVNRIIGSADRLVSIAEDAEPFVWNLNQHSDGGASDQPVAPEKLVGHQDMATLVQISPDGKRLLSGGFDATPRLWDLTADQVASTVLPIEGETSEVLAATWHPTLPIVVTGSRGKRIGIWEIGPGTTASPNGSVNGAAFFADQEISQLAIDPDSKWLAAVARKDPVANDVEAVVYPWNAIDATRQTPSSVPAIDFGAVDAKQIGFASPRGDLATLVVGSRGGSVALYGLSDVPDQSPTLIDLANSPHSGQVEAMKIVRKPDHDVIVTGGADGSIHRWQLGSIATAARLDLSSQSVLGLDVSADGRWIAAAMMDGSVWLVDGESDRLGAAYQILDSGGEAWSVWIDPAGRWLVAGYDDGVIRRWDLRHVQLLVMTHPTPLRTMELPKEAPRSDQLSRL